MRPEHLALWRTGDRPPPLSLVCQKYKLVSEERCRLLHPVPPSSLLPACSPLSVPRPLILFLIRWSGVDRDSLVQARATLVLFFGFSISAKNLCQPTCWHVFKRGGCASSRGKRRGAGPGERKGGGEGKVLEVRLLVCSVGFRSIPAGWRERNAHLELQRHVGGCIRIRARHARPACRPSHESKLFVTGGNGQEQKEGGHTCLLTISGRSCRGSYRVLLIREIWI